MDMPFFAAFLETGDLCRSFSKPWICSFAIFLETGGSSTTLTGDPTKRVKVCADIWSDQPDVPVLQHGMRLSQEPHHSSRKTIFLFMKFLLDVHHAPLSK